MGVTTTKTNKPLNPRGNDGSPLKYNRAKLFSGKALDFDGVNDIVSTTYTSGFTGAQEFTYCAYVYTNSTTARQTIIHANENTGYGLQSLQTRDGAFRFFAGTGSQGTSVLDSELYEANKWYFLVGTHTPTENKIYLNGVLNATANADELTIAPDAIVVGNYPAIVNPMDGQIANAKVFDVALTAPQVADLYNNPEKVVPTGVDNTALKLWLPMQEGAGTTAYDGSGNGNHGTISGATYTHGIGAPVSQTAVIDWNKGVNLLDEYSEDFSDSGWLKTGSQILAVSETNPFGKQTWEFGVVSLPTEVQLRANISGSTPSSTAFKSFVIAKAGTLNWLRIRNLFVAGGSTEGNVWFNLSTGSVGTEQSGQTGTMTDLGDGWYKCEVSGTTASAIPNYFFDVGFTDTDNTNEPTATGGTGLLVLSAFSLNGIYVETLGTAQTSDVLLPQGLTTGRDITGVNLFENVRKQGALNLDGNSWAEVHDNESLDFGTGSFTLEAWAKAKYTSGGSIYNVIMILGGNASTAPNAAILVDNSVRPQAMYNNNASVTPAQTTGDWYHIVAAYDETDMFVFINGAQVLQNARTAVDITNALVKYIGRDSSSQRYYTDQIAQPRIYNRALTAAEVLQNYNSGKNTYTNN